jgi:hypothetical protein
MIRRRANKISHTLQSTLRRIGVASRIRRRMIVRFSEKVGFVYFGSVDQHSDDHHIIRGLTVSISHHDDNYSVGSFDGYDVSIVDRIDSDETESGRLITHNWLIFEIDLHTTADIPHFFLGSHTHKDSAYARLFSSVGAMQTIPIGTFEPYNDEFTKRYSMFTTPVHFLDVERIITSTTARSVAAHFWPLAIEVYDNSLYVYADNQSISMHLLDTMLQNGLWLAKIIDNGSDI